MIDSVSARMQDARTIVSRAAVDLPDGECKARLLVACAALSDALEQRHADLKTLERLEVLADALTTPGIGADE